MNESVLKHLFIAGAVYLSFVGVFGWGAAVGKYQIFPYEFIKKAQDTLQYLSGPSEPHFLETTRYERSGARLVQPSKIAEGINLVTSHWASGANVGPQIRIISKTGKILHKWQVNPKQIWSKSPHNDSEKAPDLSSGLSIHGIHLLPNGDIIFNLIYFGLIRMDACGNVQWKIPYRTHHAVSRDYNGDYWVLGQKWVTNKDHSYDITALELPLAVDTVLKVSGDGEILKEIDLLNVLNQSGHQSLLVKYGQKTEDIIHANDVIIVSPKMSKHFESLQKDDIVVSLRNLNSIAVIDSTSHDIKSLIETRLLRQHDPILRPSGRISIFNNRDCGQKHSCKHWGSSYGGSEILSLSLKERKSKVIYEGTKDEPFYTKVGGDHQYLPNGNILITEMTAGRIFEIDSNGELVWEWIHSEWSNNRTPAVTQGIRYQQLSKEEIESWSCPSKG